MSFVYKYKYALKQLSIFHVHSRGHALSIREIGHQSNGDPHNLLPYTPPTAPTVHCHQKIRARPTALSNFSGFTSLQISSA
jgi:hypothetical protein